jgi:hypothetical protein
MGSQIKPKAHAVSMCDLGAVIDHFNPCSSGLRTAFSKSALGPLRKEEDGVMFCSFLPLKNVREFSF